MGGMTMNEEKTDPLEQAARDNETYDRWQQLRQSIAWGELRGRLVEREDFRKNRAVCEIQGRAVALVLLAEGLLPVSEEADPEFDGFVNMIADAIHAENLKHVMEIEQALAEFREDALTPEEIEELCR